MDTEAQRLKRITSDFEIAVYEIGRRNLPHNRRVMDALANAYAGAGRYAQALEIAGTLVRRHPNEARYRYNLACALCGVGRVSDALDELALAIELGFHDLAFMTRDPDLSALHNRPEFTQLCDRARKAKQPRTA